MNKEYEINQLSIQDMDFHTPTNTELEMIQGYAEKCSLKRFQIRFIISLIAALIIGGIEFYARYTYKTEGIYERRDSIPGMIAFVMAVFIIYNIISFIYTKVKTSLNTTANHYECLTGFITEKFDSRELSKKSHENVPNYILFSNEQGHCVTALPSSDSEKFGQTKIGDEILVVKKAPMGIISYDFVCINKRREEL